MAQEAEEGPVCCVCWEGEPPRGLADALLDQPCGCRGHLGHIHLSCLHAWQLQRLNANPLADVATCDVCRQLYSVPEQQWEALVAAGGIDGGERQRVREQQRLWLQDPAQIPLMELRQQAAQLRQGLQQQAARLRQELQQARRLRLQPQDLAQFRRAVDEQLQMLARARQATEALQREQAPALVPALREQLQLLQQDLRQLEQGWTALLEVLHPTLVQALAELLHALRLGGGWLTQPAKFVLAYCHAMPAVFDSSELPATEPPRPSLLHRLLHSGGVTAGVLGILALSERQQLGSWEAVWREGYSAQFAKRTAWQLGWLALLTWVGQVADPGHNAPGAPSHQPEMAALPEAWTPVCLFVASMSLSNWPSLLNLVRWVPSAYWAVLCSMVSWLAQACRAAVYRPFRPVPFPPCPPINWPVMPALVECRRLLDAFASQKRDDKERTAIARQCLALLQQRPHALRRFADACAPRSPSLFARVCSMLSRFLPFLPPSK